MTELENIVNIKNAIKDLTHLEKWDVVFGVIKKLGIALPDEIEKLKPIPWDKAFCPCGGIILADTENCTVPLCVECTIEIVKSYK